MPEVTTYHFDDPPRCEADHKDGGVCRRVLRYPDWSCPGEADHAPSASHT